MFAITLRPSLLLTVLALCFRPASASPIPDRNANFLFARSAAPDAHGLTGGQIVIIASVAILGIVCLVVAGIVGCYLCAKIEYQDRQRRREMQQEEQGLIVSCQGEGGNKERYGQADIQLEDQDPVDSLPSPYADAPQPTSASTYSGLSGSTAYVSLPGEEHPPRYDSRDTPLEVLRTKNFLFNHNK